MLSAGEKVRGIETSGGGCGDPLEREPALVLSDIVNGMETVERARDVYGVAILDDRDADRLLVDVAATASLRGKLREPKQSAGGQAVKATRPYTQHN